MALTKSEPIQLGNIASLDTSSSYSFTPLNTSEAIACGIEVIYDFENVPSGSILVNAYGSVDGVNFADVPTYSQSFSPGQSGRATFQYDVVAFKYLKIVCTNNTDQPVVLTVNAITVAT